MGFAPRKEKPSPFALLGFISALNSDLLRILEEERFDGILVEELPAGEVSIPWGIHLRDEIEEGRLRELSERGCDFVILEASSLPVGVLEAEGPGKILKISPSLRRELVRAMSFLSIDAFLLERWSGALTIECFADYAKLISMAGREVIIELPEAFSPEELASLWRAGARGVMVDLRGDPPERARMARRACEISGEIAGRRKRKLEALLPPPPPVEEEEEEF